MSEKLIRLSILGARGSIPVSGDNMSKYGGDTSCYELTIGSEVIYLDAGTGIVNANPPDDKNISIIISHPHIDHIMGLPFFPAMNEKGRKIRIYSCKRGGLSTRQQIDALMSPPLWPVTLDAYPADIECIDIEEEFFIGDIRVNLMECNHPGGGSSCISIVAKDGKRSEKLVYATDFEHEEDSEERLIEFAAGADILLYDAQYAEDEYPSHIGYGHSTASVGMRIKEAAGIKELLFIHHDPHHNDEVMDSLSARICIPDVYYAKVDRRKRSGDIYSLERMNRLAIDMTTEKDANLVLDHIITEAMDISNCDGGTVYVLDGDHLYFNNMITKSKHFKKTAADPDFNIPPVRLNRSSVCAVCALDHKKINLADIYDSKEYDFSGALKYDSLNGYRTKSMLVIPMVDAEDHVIGVLQLINALNAKGEIIPFPKKCEEVISALASLAAVSVNNIRLTRAIYDMLHSFVKVMVDAVDARSTYNANHTKSMVSYGKKFIAWLDDGEHGWRIRQEDQDPLLMSIWLHDIGKLVIPLEIMDKPTRLGKLEEGIKNRIRIAALCEELLALKGEKDEKEAREAIEKLNGAAELIERANTAGVLEDETVEELKELSGFLCLTPEGDKMPLLNGEELDAITVKRGTLTFAERRMMESHVTYTAKLLSKMKFEGSYEKVPQWASKHHELLNGTGYPDGLGSKDIPKEVRLITIIDVYDALTAEDRPYKPPMEPEKAFEVLRGMASEGKIDSGILEMFIESEAWRA